MLELFGMDNLVYVFVTDSKNVLKCIHATFSDGVHEWECYLASLGTVFSLCVFVVCLCAYVSVCNNVCLCVPTTQQSVGGSSFLMQPVSSVPVTTGGMMRPIHMKQGSMHKHAGSRRRRG